MNDSKFSLYRILIGYGFFLMVMYFFSKSEFGYTVIYYSLALTLLLLLVRHYQDLVWLLEPIQTPKER